MKEFQATSIEHISPKEPIVDLSRWHWEFLLIPDETTENTVRAAVLTYSVSVGCGQGQGYTPKCSDRQL
jgi:hypothetical protein